MRTRLRILLIAVGVVMATGVSASGKLYRWVDANGKVHFSDRPVAQAEELKLRVPGVSTPPEERADAEGENQARAAECQRKREQLNTYTSASRIIEKDNLGREKEYTADEKQQLVEKTREAITQLCPE